MTKYCRDCKWVSIDYSGMRFAKCHAPQNVDGKNSSKDNEVMILISPDIQMPDKGAKYHCDHCSIQRSYNCFDALTMGRCGKSGRWYVQDDKKITDRLLKE